MNERQAVYGATRRASCCAVGSPCTVSSQWIVVSLVGCFAASSRSSSAKITDFSSRLA